MCVRVLSPGRRSVLCGKHSRGHRKREQEGNGSEETEAAAEGCRVGGRHGDTSLGLVSQRSGPHPVAGVGAAGSFSEGPQGGLSSLHSRKLTLCRAREDAVI